MSDWKTRARKIPTSGNVGHAASTHQPGAPQPPPDGPTTSQVLSAYGHGARKGAVLGTDEEVGGFLQALMQARAMRQTMGMPADIRAKSGIQMITDANNRPMSLADVYRLGRDGNVREQERVRSEGGAGRYLAGNILGGAALPLGTAKTLWQSAKLGGAMGGGTGLMDSDADLTRGEIAEAATDTGAGAVFGAAGGAGGFALLSRLAPWIWKTSRGGVEQSPAAQFLASKGVDDLTMGQMAPGSSLDQIEQASQSATGFGSAIQKQRQAGRESWQDAALREAAPPPLPPSLMRPEGSPLKTEAGEIWEMVTRKSPADQLDDLYTGFGRNYDAVRGSARPVDVSRVADDFRAAANNPKVTATDDDIKKVMRFLENEATAVKRAPQFALPPSGAAEELADPVVALMKARSNIRDEGRIALKQQDHTTARLLSGADDAATRTIEKALPDDAAALLKATDAKYRAHKILEDAIAGSGDQPAGFTPAQLSAAVRRAMERGEYARGGGGTLRDLARAGREVLDQTVPPTGARLITTGGAWTAYPAAGFAALSNSSPKMRAFLLGEHAVQRGMKRTEDFLKRQTLLQILRERLRPDRGLAVAAGEEQPF